MLASKTRSSLASPDLNISTWIYVSPPQIDPQAFLEKKIEWRYAKGLPKTANGNVFLGDSSSLLSKITDHSISPKRKTFKLLFTSPPYIGISDYHRDQWLRLWMLGNEPVATRSKKKYRSAFSSSDEYKKLLHKVFFQASELMSQSGYVYVRTDARPLTFEITREVLRSCFPQWREEVVKQPYAKETQTALYGDKSKKPGEIDIILSGPQAIGARPRLDKGRTR